VDEVQFEEGLIGTKDSSDDPLPCPFSLPCFLLMMMLSCDVQPVNLLSGNELE